jgi:hypothetical protein
MEAPQTKTTLVQLPTARQQRLRRWARSTLWVAGTSLVLLDCGMHALIKPRFDGGAARLDRELGEVTEPAQSAASSIGERDGDLYLPPGLRSGSFE